LCFLYEEKLDLNPATYNLLLVYIEDVISARDFPETGLRRAGLSRSTQDWRLVKQRRNSCYSSSEHIVSVTL
jgi:hypothetical protein